MADLSKYIQAQKFSLAVGISTSDTSITLQSFNFPSGEAIASGDLSAINYATLEPGTTREEQVSFTGITTNADTTVTLTGVTRGLGFGSVDTYSEQSNLKVQHGAGSVLILSNTAAFYDTFVNKKNDEEITGTLTVPTPTLSGHAVTKAYADGLVTGGLSQDKVVVAGTAGESVSAGDLVYFDDTDNEWKKTDANTVSTIDNVLLGIAQGSGSDGVAITDGVLVKGVDETQTGMTVGVKLYASDTAGAIAESAGTNTKVIGFSYATTGLYFDPTFGELPSSGEKEAQAGGGDFGAPSASNKFVTEDYLDFKSTQQITYAYADSPATWTKDTGLVRIRVQAWGAGGSGACANLSFGGGGGGGGYAEHWFEASELGATETITIGAGGASVGPTLTAGNAGGVTTFGSLLTAYAGGRGYYSNTSSDTVGGGGSGPMGSGGSGSSNSADNAGSPGVPLSANGRSADSRDALYGGAGGLGGSAGGSAYYGGGGGGGSSQVNAGSGGTSIFGGAGGSGGHNNASGTDGAVPGGGGGSCELVSTAVSGAGGDGQVIVTEYYL